MRACFSLFLITLLLTGSANAESYTYSCRACIYPFSDISCDVGDGKAYPMRIDEDRGVLDWRGASYSISKTFIDVERADEGCPKGGWRAKRNGIEFRFCHFEKGVAGIVDKSGDRRVQCSLGDGSMAGHPTDRQVGDWTLSFIDEACDCSRKTANVRSRTNSKATLEILGCFKNPSTSDTLVTLTFGMEPLKGFGKLNREWGIGWLSFGRTGARPILIPLGPSLDGPMATFEISQPIEDRVVSLCAEPEGRQSNCIQFGGVGLSKAVEHVCSAAR